MRVHINIDTRTFVRFWLVIIGFGVAALALYSARAALIIIFVSIFFALALNGPVSRLARRLPGKSRVGATAISYVIVLIALAAVIFLVIPPIIEQTARFLQHVPDVVNQVIAQWQGLNHLVDQYNLREQTNSALASLQGQASGWASHAGQFAISGIGSIFSFSAAAILVIVLTFLMLVEGPAWMKSLWGIYNNEARMLRHRRITQRMYGVFKGYVVGQLTVSAIDGACAGVAVFILSLIFPEIPANLAMPTAAIAFVSSMIPMFGATIGGILVTALLAFNNVPAAIIYAIYFVVYQQVENNWISPAIQSKRIDLSPLAVLVSVTIGLYVFGIVGGIISIPIAGSIRVLIEEYLAKAKEAREESTEKPLAKLIKKIKPNN